MKCPKCQVENPETKKFCFECGSKLSYFCPHCGSEVLPNEKFCGECGSRIGKPDQVNLPPQAKSAPMPRYLAEKILTSRSALEGERKQVTVLFADVKGSMELLADRDPEDAGKILEPVLKAMIEAVHQYEGTVNNVMGDGIMALFGAPLAHEDHAVRACYAALRMQDAIRRYSRELRRDKGIDVLIRVGLNSGEVVVGSIDSNLRMEYTAVGQTTHLAARMEQLAAPGSIRLSAGTLRVAEGFIEVNSLGPVPVKGLAEPVEVFELIGAKSVRSRLQPSLIRGLSRFVGRNSEMQQLKLALQRARGGNGQVVAVVGEPGVGKSRLFHEFAHSQSTQGWLILEAASFSYGKSTTFLPVIELLKRYFRIHDLDSPREVKEKVTGKLLTLDRSLEPTMPEFLSLLNVPADPSYEKLDPLQRRLRTLHAMKRLIIRESQDHPVLVIFEDLHWVDGETQAILDSLVDALPKNQILLLVNYRPEYQHSWANKTYYDRIRLGPLESKSAGEFLNAVLGNDPSLEHLKRTLIERTGGNPLFLEESVRMLVETQVLLGDRGAYLLARTMDTIQIPATVETILVARIDRLPVEEKNLLQCAAAIGKDLPYPLLREVLEIPEEHLRRGLAHLQTAEFIYETHLFPELEYTFKHALTYEVAYSSLLHNRRLVLHSKIMEVMERLYHDHIYEHLERLAHHALRAEVWNKALNYLRQAANKAIFRSAHREAVAYLESALKALSQIPENRETQLLGIDLRFELRTGLIMLAEFSRIFQVVREAESLAKMLNDSRRLGQALVYMSISFYFAGNNREAVGSGERALAVSEDLNDLGVQIQAHRIIGMSYLSSTDYRRAVDHLSKSLELLEGQPYRNLFGFATMPAINSRAFRAWSQAELGKFSEATRDAEEAVRIAEALEHPASQSMAYWAVGSVHLRKGDFGTAMRFCERALNTAKDANLPLLFQYFERSAGLAYAHSGRLNEAKALLETAAERAKSINQMAHYALTLMAIAEANLLAGNLSEAEVQAEGAFELSCERKEPGNQAYTLHLLGEIASRAEKLERGKAESAYQRSMALAANLGMQPLVSQCHLGLGRLYRQSGILEKAKEHLNFSKNMFREMEMNFWLEKAEKEKLQLS